MQENNIDFTMPRGWSEMTDRQLRYLYRHIAADYSADEIRQLCLMRWNKTRVLGRSTDGTFALKKGKRIFDVSAEDMAALLPYLQWMGEIPSEPVRPSSMRGHKALPSDFEDVPFESYIIVDNLYQGYLSTQSEELLDELAAVLYPGLKTPHTTGNRILSTLRSPLSAWQRIAVFYWVASLKDFFARRYPDFFTPTIASTDGNLLGSPQQSVEDAMNAQIRALTKGDVTKEKEILALDTWRALTELNAQAREYKELNAKLKSK